MRAPLSTVARLTNESIFASLMLTITVSALIDKPDVVRVSLTLTLSP